MKYKDFQRLAKKYLLPQLPGFAMTRNLIYHERIEHLLRAFCFERSDDPTAFHLTVFFQPLYVPKEHEVFTFGHRLDGRIHWWSITKHPEAEVMDDVLQQVQTDGVSFLDRFQTPADLVAAIEELGDLAKNTHDVEAYAYSLILIDEHNQAGAQLSHLHQLCQDNPYKAEWLYDQMHRGDRVLAALKRNPAEAKQLLLNWRKQTLTALKLERLAAPITE